MTTMPFSPSDIDNPYALAVVVLLALPSILTYLGNQRVKKVEKTLTTNNGGSHIKDKLDRMDARGQRIEEDLKGYSARLEALEAHQSAAQQPHGLLRRLFI